MATVEAAVKAPVQKLASFGREWGIPLATGVAGFAAGDFLNFKGLVGPRLNVQTVSVAGFSFDVVAWFSIFVYAMAALLVAVWGRKLHVLLGRAGFTFFVGALTRQLFEMFNFTQNLVQVS